MSSSVSKRKRETGPLDDAAFDFDPSVVGSPGLGGKLENMADLFAGVPAPTASPVKMVPPPVKPPPKRRAKRGESDKNLKGLRHFSIKVCQKVEEKGCTTYNEVADALVKEYIEGQMAADEMVAQVGTKKYDEKNIRRRVYDALNVLMAMDIISKEKKEITWRGLPNNATMDFDVLERQRLQIGATIARKQRHLQDKVRQLVAFKQLLERNATVNAENAAAAAADAQDAANKASHAGGAASSGGTAAVAAEGGAAQSQQQQEGVGASEQEAPRPPAEKIVTLPFVMVNTHSSNLVEVTMADGGREVDVALTGPFTLNDENMVLQHMSLHEASDAKLRALLPAHMLPYANMGPDKTVYRHPAARLAEQAVAEAAAKKAADARAAKAGGAAAGQGVGESAAPKAAGGGRRAPLAPLQQQAAMQNQQLDVSMAGGANAAASFSAAGGIMRSAHHTAASSSPMSALETPRAMTRQQSGLLSAGGTPGSEGLSQGLSPREAMPFASPSSMFFSPNRLMAEPFLFSPPPGGTPGAHKEYSMC